MTGGFHALHFVLSPAAAVPEHWHRKIIHGRMRLGDMTVMASDAKPGTFFATRHAPRATRYGTRTGRFAISWMAPCERRS